MAVEYLRILNDISNMILKSRLKIYRLVINFRRDKKDIY